MNKLPEPNPNSFAPLRLCAFASALFVVFCFARLASAQSVVLQLESHEAYAGLPVVLTVTASDFDENPEPTVSEFDIDGCQLTYLGVTPNVSRMIQIVNGVRSERTDITFVFRYRILAETPGGYTVPAIVVEQGGIRVEHPAASFTVNEIASSSDMRIQLNLPDRAVWVGETVEVTLDWDLRVDANDQNLIVPLFDTGQDFAISAAPDRGRAAFAFTIGSRQIDLPYERLTGNDAQGQFTRFRFFALVRPQRSGTIEIPPSRVFAQLQTGYGTDRFGFRTARWDLFQSEDIPRQLEVHPLPLTGQPESFNDAVGSGFSIHVEANRTVVRLGDPIDLDVIIQGDGNLEGLGLPRLDGQGGLDPSQFFVPDDAPIGEMLEDDLGKLFRVTVRVQSTDVSEIPPIAFSYFDPERGEYTTVTSEPIAVSVAGSAVVRADDVVSVGQDSDSTQIETIQVRETTINTLMGAELSLSDETQALSTVLQPKNVVVAIATLYVLPFLILIARIWQLRTRKRRGLRSDVRRAYGQLQTELEKAKNGPARDAAPRIVAALQALSRAAGVPPKDGAAVIERLETEAFDPSAASKSLSRAIRDDVIVLGSDWLKTDSPQSPNGRGKTVLLILVLLGIGISMPSLSQAQDELEQLRVARQAYGEALEQSERADQIRLFGIAADGFEQLANEQPARSALLTDWGNAALGARRLGEAVLAYRRAIHYDETNERAQRNLDWVRDQEPAWLPRPSKEGTIDRLFFWQGTVTPAQSLLIAAAAFAVGILLLVPWFLSRQQRRSLRILAVIPFLIWAVLTGSMFFQVDASDDAVVMVDDSVLRSADNFGAPAAFSNPLPAGTEVTIIQQRSDWTRVGLANGVEGWLPTQSVEDVVELSSDPN